ncbi:hypothetical protein QUB05_17155 [Microcoleus sp. F10-C6]|uniref:hypothetical protein n=1 Tax=unclassified Microcoleus TaxID=2642155 RepID=UPI002FD7771B
MNKKWRICGKLSKRLMKTAGCRLTISLEELGQLKEVGVYPSDTELGDTLKEVDFDLSGSIDFEEFKTVMLSNPHSAGTIAKSSLFIKMRNIEASDIRILRTIFK